MSAIRHLLVFVLFAAPLAAQYDSVDFEASDIQGTWSTNRLLGSWQLVPGTEQVRLSLTLTGFSTYRLNATGPSWNYRVEGRYVLRPSPNPCRAQCEFAFTHQLTLSPSGRSQSAPGGDFYWSRYGLPDGVNRVLQVRLGVWRGIGKMFWIRPVDSESTDRTWGFNDRDWRPVDR